MKYAPALTGKQAEDNHKLFNERRILYKEKGLDFLKSREFILKKTGPLQGNILDVGSGKGIMALSLAKAGYSFTSVDNKEEMLRITALNLAYENLLSKAELYVMDAYLLEFGENSFNNVFIVEALHHMDDIEGIFSEVDRVLSQKGKLVLADFNKEGMKIVNLIHAHEGHKHESSFIGRDEAESWLNRNGYKIKKYEDKCHWILIADKK
ncbi:MAG: class I SAM-dependent methyltransferase [Candidatus Omnitrophica bacterium]|nr:class I SAM-dependent methyltransferase [Candidatus Omnitrophota bacterium]